MGISRGPGAGLPGRTGPGGEAKPLCGVRAAWASCAHTAKGSCGRRKGFCPPRPCRGCRGGSGVTFPCTDPSQAIVKHFKHIPSVSIWKTVETGNRAQSLPHCHIAAARGARSSQVPPSPPSAPAHHEHWRCGTAPPWCTGQPHTLPFPCPLEANEPHPIPLPRPPARAEPSLGALAAASAGL